MPEPARSEPPPAERTPARAQPPDWRRLVREHLPPLPLRPEREAAVVCELAQLLEDAHAESIHAREEWTDAQAVAWMKTQIPEWKALAEEIRRLERRRPPAGPVHCGERKAQPMSTLHNDLRFAFRMLTKNPGFTLVAAVTLALGIGLNSAVFSLINAVLLRPLPLEAPEDLANIYSTSPRYSGVMGHLPMAYPDYLDLAERTDAFSDLVAYAFNPLVLERDEESRVVYGEIVTGNYFRVLGIPTSLGRAISEDDNRPGQAEAVAVLSHRTWKLQFGADPEVIGELVRVNGQAVTVVGVAAESYPGMMPGVTTELFLPLGLATRLAATGATSLGDPTPGLDQFSDRARRWVWTIGRLRQGAGFEQAAAEVKTHAASFEEAYPETNEERSFALVPTRKVRLLPGVTRVLFGASAVLMAIVGLVLLIACANIANMLLARAVSRRKEIATRLALGAGRRAVLRQLLIESLALALLGGLLGLAVAVASNRALNSLTFPSLIQLDLGLELDVRVLLFTLSIATVTAVVFGLAPAFTATRGDLVSSLREDSRGTTSGISRRRLRGVLVVAQVALALFLLICAGLSLRSMENAHRIDPGFDPEGVTVARFVPPGYGLKSHEIDDFYRRLRERVETYPEVRSAGFAGHLPLSVVEFSLAYAAPEGTDKPPEEWPEADTVRVDAGYFETLDIPILRGRNFAERDQPGTPGVIVVNEAFAERFWPGEDPVGRRVLLQGVKGTFEVVGVTENGKYRSLGEEGRLFVYRPLSQTRDDWRTLVVRAAGDPAALLAAIRRDAKAIDRRIALTGLGSMSEAISPSFFLPRMSAALFGAFGLIGLLLATTGIYGVLAYMASQRTHEIGIRLAMGAGRGDILRLVVRDGFALTFWGVVLGLAAALAATRLLRAILYGISATDILTFTAVPLVLGAVAFLACYVPARRASRVDPLEALRYE